MNGLPTNLTARASCWDRLRLWVHDKRFAITEILPVSDRVLLFQCSCGGYAQVQHEAKGSTWIEQATCARWVMLERLQRGAGAPEAPAPLPSARVVP